MHLNADDFALFELPRRFALERAQLDARWKALLQHAHPDRFASEGASAQRLAMQWSVRINEAYQRLKEPLTRAAYLCELQGAPLRAHDNTAMPLEFLQQQIAWREALEDAHDGPALEALHQELEQARSATLACCAELLDVQQDATAAAQQVRALMFVARLLQNVEQRLDQLTP